MSQIIFDRKFQEKIIKERLCGPFRFERFNFDLGSLDRTELQRLWLAHANGLEFSRQFKDKKKVIATTGFGLTGVPHVGTIAEILMAIRLQRAGIPVQIVLGDLDAYNGKSVELESVLNRVAAFSRFIKKLGFDDQTPNILRTQYQELNVLRTLYLTGKYLTDELFEQAKEDVHDFYSQRNKIDEMMTYRIKLSLNLMVADFLDLHSTRGFDAVLVFLGIDEYKYCGLAMQVLAQIKKSGVGFADFVLAGMFSPILPGFNGYPKMSKSFPDSGIDVSIPIEKVHDLIINQEEAYARPEDSLVYQMIAFASLYSAQEVNRAYESCKTGGLVWIREKEKYVVHLAEIWAKWT